MSKSGNIHGEETIIQDFLAPLAAGYPGAFGLKDDCAAFTPTPGHDLIVKTDPIASDVHFFPHDAPEDIGWKALAVNVSDLAAKGAIPRAYLMALSFPEAPTRDWMQCFAQGLGEAQRAFGMHLIGGDTDRRPGPITVSITVFGEVPAGRMVRRGTAKPGDFLYVTGTLGDALAGLQILKDRGEVTRSGFSERDVVELLGRFYRPQPRLAMRPALRNHASAAMDISDGLIKDLRRMCKASGCGAVVDQRLVPLSAPLQNARQVPHSWQGAALVAGDDYELLIAVPPSAVREFEADAQVAGVEVTRIGVCNVGDACIVLGGDGQPLELAYAGWDHF